VANLSKTLNTSVYQTQSTFAEVMHKCILVCFYAPQCIYEWVCDELCFRATSCSCGIRTLWKLARPPPSAHASKSNISVVTWQCTVRPTTDAVDVEKSYIICISSCSWNGVLGFQEGTDYVRLSHSHV